VFLHIHKRGPLSCGPLSPPQSYRHPNREQPKTALARNNRFGLLFCSCTCVASPCKISHYDDVAAHCDCLARVNTILVDFCRDMWAYVSLGYFTQTIKKNEVGSSAMPHKVQLTMPTTHTRILLLLFKWRRHRLKELCTECMRVYCSGLVFFSLRRRTLWCLRRRCLGVGRGP